MVKIQLKQRHTLRRSKQSKLWTGLKSEIGDESELFTSPDVEMVETTGDITLYLLDKKPLIFEMRDEWVFPTLKGALERPFTSRRITVDSGAVPHMANGANVMRPGVVSITDDVKAGRPVVIAEERYNKPLAIGIALFDAEEMKEIKSGKVAKNIHAVGDEIWNLEI